MGAVTARRLVAALSIGIVLSFLPEVTEAQDRAPREPTPPGFNNFKIRQDTPEQRAEFLRQRARELEAKRPQSIPPLPAQTITPERRQP